jgi:putative salt-induced outer membrane protein
MSEIAETGPSGGLTGSPAARILRVSRLRGRKPLTTKRKDPHVSFDVRRFLLISALLAAPAAQAQWSGKAELGVLLSDGNTESKSANTKLDLTHEGTQWRNNVYAAALYGENAEFANAERYEVRYQADWKITDKLSWFFGLRGEQDRFSGFAYQATASTGVTYKFIENPRTKLDASFGAGYRRLQPQVLVQLDSGEVIDRIRGDDESDPVATLGSNYEHAFTESTKITNKLLAEAGADNTAVQDDVALAVAINETLALAVGIGVRYNSDPPAGSESTDTLFTVNLVYNIK